MAVKVIRDDIGYAEAIRRLEELADADVGTPAGDEADVLSTLIDLYEKQNEAIEKPTALEAIKFRMEQLDLKPRDLVPDIGSRSRVSEVLSGQRPLTIDMIRSLHERWGIPLASLINVENFERVAKPQPAKAVLKRLESLGMMKMSDDFYDFRSKICGDAFQAAYRRRTTSTADPVALDAWCVAAIARSFERCDRFSSLSFSRQGDDFLRELAKCSARSNGALAARDVLAGIGICFVILPHMPGTHLDGAAMIRKDGVPVVALTLRHDRIDNFWFTLLHECSHILLDHVSKDQEAILDDLEIASSDDIETEADQHALDALVPPRLWQQLGANEYTSTTEIFDVAHEAGVHPAIVAGMWRKAQNNYRKFSGLLGHGTLKKLFESEMV
ncbi:MAG: hypothetical protein U1E03_08490 [Hyphomonadaceae bacterium]